MAQYNESVGPVPGVGMDEVRAHLDEATAKGELSSKSRNTVLRVMEEIGLEAFPTSVRSDWIHAYRKARPSSGVGLAGKSLKALEGLTAWMRGRKLDAKIRICQEKAEAEKAAEDDARAKRVAEEESAARNPVYSRRELKAVVDMMEYCGLESVDLVGIRRFFSLFGVRIPSMPDTTDAPSAPSAPAPEGGKA